MESQVPEIPVTEPPKPKDNHWITILSMALFVVASLSITGFLYYQNQQLKSMLASYQNTPSPTPTATTDPTANWKTYTNDAYKFSFKYPGDLNIENNQVDTSNYIQLIFNKSLTDSFTIEASTKYPVNQPKYLLDTQPIGTKNINGYDWGLFKLPNNSSGTQIEINSVLYSIIYPTENEAGIDQILSTFKFLDLALFCQEAEGKWLEKYNECEGVSLDKQFCKENGGIFSECESPCRHDPQSTICLEVCMRVCKFKQ